jgi:hypothetical protein
MLRLAERQKEAAMRGDWEEVYRLALERKWLATEIDRAPSQRAEGAMTDEELIELIRRIEDIDGWVRNWLQNQLREVAGRFQLLQTQLAGVRAFAWCRRWDESKPRYLDERR